MDEINDVGAALRRLIPFPGFEAVSPLSLLPLPGQRVGQPSNSAEATLPGIVGEQAASIVSQAASILDEEMAKGVLAARRSTGTALPGNRDAGNPALRQVHDLIDNLAAMWPAMQPATPHRSGSSAATTDTDPLAELRPRATVRPGQRATISMTLCNRESRPVRLVPSSTDLLGHRSGRIASDAIEFSPRECSLEPQDQQDLTISTLVPPDTRPGSYSGLLVVRGVDYLRALITVDVV